MRALIVLCLVVAAAQARTYDLPLTAESLAHMTESILVDLGSYTRISLRGAQAEPFYRGAAALWGHDAYLLGLWLRPSGEAVVLAAPSGVRLAEWRLYAAGSDGRARALPTHDVQSVLDELALISQNA